LKSYVDPDVGNKYLAHEEEEALMVCMYASSGGTLLEGLEKGTREERKGLWADPQLVPPWE
jgi:hypothetical protein